MVTFIEPLFKSSASIKFGWNPEPGVTVSSYNIYVGKVPGILTEIVGGISPRVSNDTPAYKKIVYDVPVSLVISTLSLASTVTFDTLDLYWAITYVDSLGSESSITASTVVEVPPVGITGKTRREDPTANRYIFGFSDQLQRWIKAASTSSGAIIVSSSGYYQDNITTAYTYDASSRVLTEKYYRSDMTETGAPAKLVSYTYGTGGVTLKVVSDSTV
jgi:hypothetical protein